MHRRLDCSLRHWRRVRARFRGPRASWLAGAADTVSGLILRPRHGAHPVSGYAARLWSWCRRIENTEPDNCQVEKPYEPWRIRARPLCLRRRRQPSAEHSCLTIGAVREGVQRARRRRAEHYRAFGAPVAPRAARSMRTLYNLERLLDVLTS